MLKYILLTLLGLLLIGCGRTLDIAGVKYRTTGGYKADLGIAGVKRTTGFNMFDPKDYPIYGDKLQALTRTVIYNERLRKVAASVAAKRRIPETELNFETDYSNSEKGRFVVIEIMNPLEAARRLNDPVNIKLFNYLTSVKRPRIITSVAVAYDYEKIKEFKFDAAGQVPVKQIEKKFCLNFSTIDNKVLHVSDGTIFAYEISRIIWRMNGDKIEAFDLSPDRVGSDQDDIPEGMSDDPLKLKNDWLKLHRNK